MTDETPDPLTDETTPAAGEGPEFVVTPTLRAFGELLVRVEQLEADSPAHPGDDVEDEAEDAQLQARLGRHRTEIEQIKATINALIRYLTIPGVELPNPIPPVPVAEPATPTPTPGATP